MKSSWILSDSEKKSALSMLKKGKEEEKANERFAVFSFKELYQLLGKEEIELIEKFNSLDPKNFDYRLPYLGAEHPTDLVVLKNQAYTKDGKQEVLPTQYLPRKSFEAYERLSSGIEQDLGKKLLVLYGYRSPARQIFLFFDHLDRTYHFDFAKTLERVCFPDYSEHVCPSHQGMDFITEKGVKGVGFDATDEYRWLVENAGKYGFTESYRQGNQLGMMWEPWHWRYVKS